MGALPQLYAATMPDVRADDYFGPDGFAEQRGHPKRADRTKAASDVRRPAPGSGRPPRSSPASRYPWP